MPCKPPIRIKPKQYYQTTEDIIRNMQWYIDRYKSLLGDKLTADTYPIFFSRRNK